MELKNVSFSYHQKKIIDDISYKFSESTIYSLIGKSGTGKTTILKLLAGLINPQSGEVVCAKRIGYVIQGGGLFNHLNVRKNITLEALYQKKDTVFIQQKLQELCHFFQIPESYLEKDVFSLSGGQKQRVAIMRALFLDPDALFFDESFSGLDPIIKFEILDQIKESLKEKPTIVLHVSHDLLEVQALSDETIFVCSGKFLEVQKTKLFFESPKFDETKKFLKNMKLL